MQVRQLILTASAFVIASAGPAHAQDSAHVAGDSGLQSLVAEALAQNPTIAQRQAAVLYNRWSLKRSPRTRR